MKDDTVELVKFRSLKRALGLREWAVAGVLECLWLFARKNARYGDVGRFTNEEIAGAIEWEGDADDLVKALTDTKWLDPVDGPSRLVCHDWPEHAPNFICRWLAKNLSQPETRTCTDALRNAWRRKFFGREDARGFTGRGADTNGTRPAGALECAENVPLTCARVTQPSPTKPNPTGAGEPDAVSSSWFDVSEVLKSYGVDLPEKAIETAQQHGNTPSEVMRIVGEWTERGRPNGPGCLYNKICMMKDGGKVGWPKPPAEVVSEQARAATAKASDDATAKLRRERAEAEKRRESEALERDRLEAEFGAALDKASRVELKKMIEAEMTPESARFEIGRMPPKGPLPTGPLRTRLLRHLESKSQPARTP